MAGRTPGLTRGLAYYRVTKAAYTLSPLPLDHRPRSPHAVSHFILKLYVTGKSARAAVAIANLQRICEEELDGRYELQIIDVLEHPELAEADKILATPTLIKRLPPPLRRVIGDLSDKHKVMLGLELRPDGGTGSEAATT
jgi:circadian clock protein KaiB